MGKILVERRYLDEIRRNRPINQGKEGSCYFFKDDNVVVKLFHLYDKKRKIYFMENESLYIAFPIDILIDSCSLQIAGYTMNYMPGEKFVSGFRSNLPLADLKKAYQILKLEVLKYKDIYMYDNCLANMLFDYNKKRINLIDTSRWYPEENGVLKNLENLNWQLMTSLCRANLDWVNNPLNQDKKLHELYRMHKLANQSLPMEFLEELEIKMSERNNEKVKTIGDLNYRK